MSTAYRYLNFGLIVWLFLKFVSNAIAETPKEQVQGSTDQVIKVLQTIRSPQEINKNRNALLGIHEETDKRRAILKFCNGHLRGTFSVKRFNQAGAVRSEAVRES